MRISITLLSCLTVGCQEYDLKGGERPANGLDDTSLPTSTPDEPTGPVTSTTPDPPLTPGPEIDVDPMQHDFGQLLPGCVSDMRLVRIMNLGAEDLDVSAITLDDPAGVFRLEPGVGPGTLPPDGMYEFNVDFTAAEGRAYTASLQVDSNDADEPRVSVELLGSGSDDGVVTDAWTQQDAPPADVLFVVDSSGSMEGEIDNLADSFDVFIQQFVGLGLDYQIGVITLDMDEPTQAGRIQGPIITSALPDPVGAFRDAVDVGTNGAAEERGQDAAHAALSPPLIDYENVGLVRAGSNLSVVVVTDEDDDSDMRSADFASFLDGYQGSPSLSSFSAVAGPTGGLLPCMTLFGGISADPAPRYWDTVQRTGGIHASICHMDMSDILKQLSYVAANMQTEFALSAPVTDRSEMEVEVDGVDIPYDGSHSDGWDYDETTGVLSLFGPAIPLPGATLTVRYPSDGSC